jgi:hypothetical protein
MHLRRVLIGALALTAGLANAQTRKATGVGGGNASSGKCTVEVMVDGAAQVEIKGDTATLKDLAGQAPQWRRFECTGPLPANPANFRFAGVDGRGRQTLARDPRNNGGTAVIQIEDSQGGAEGYTFDLFWGNEPLNSGGFQGGRGPGPVDNRGPGGFDNRGPGPGPGDNRQFDRADRNDQGFRPDGRTPDRDGYRRERRMPDDQAFDICRRSIREQAVTRFRTQNVDIRNITIDNNPGRRDWINGDVAVPRRFSRQDIYHFTCSVNFDTGEVRSTHIDQFEQGYYNRK